MGSYSIPIRDNAEHGDHCFYHSDRSDDATGSSFSSGRATPLHQNTYLPTADRERTSMQQQHDIDGLMRMSYQNGHHTVKHKDIYNSNEIVMNGGSNGGIEAYGDGMNKEAGESCASLDRSAISTHSRGSLAASVAEDWNPMVHAQCLILGLAFGCVWSPQNLMAPNLTQMGDFFHFSSSQRDLYLGSNIFFATAVLSLPISGLIGLYSDLVHSRKKLYAYTVIAGGIACIVTGSAKSYLVLYWARFINGGCMAGATPVAFSFLGDLFHTEQRNAASSALTSCMGAGIALGQVYAGTVGPRLGWQYPFYVCGSLCIFSAVLILLFVEDPVRGGKEEVLQAIIRKGGQYDRKLTWEGFKLSMRTNRSNRLLFWQGFFSSVPWGIMFCFLNDYLSQEKGLSVPNATYLVMVFGVGCAFGGILGGWIGQETTKMNRSYMPIFMSVTTFLGTFPLLWILDAPFESAGVFPCFFAFLSGFIGSLPSVNGRPALINVNPPESRGATLTAANLIINSARGIGPAFVTATMATFHCSRQTAFNVLIPIFWAIAAVQLMILAKTLPEDQDAMEKELSSYANTLTCGHSRDSVGSFDDDDLTSVISIEERMTAFDQHAALESLKFVESAIMEIGGRGSLQHIDRSVDFDASTDLLVGEVAEPSFEVSWSPPNHKGGYGSNYFFRGNHLQNDNDLNGRDKWLEDSNAEVRSIA